MQGDDFQVIFIHQGEHFQVTFIQLDVTLLMFCSPVKCFTNFFKILGLLAGENESQGPWDSFATARTQGPEVNTDWLVFSPPYLTCLRAEKAI